MKLPFLFSISLLASQALLATNHSITISGFSYSPATLVVGIGDVVSIDASGSHPLIQVSKADWLGGVNTEMPGGWGMKTSMHTLTIGSLDTIYFGCKNHISSGMKGMIVVEATNKTAVPQLSALLQYQNPAPAANFAVTNSNNQTVNLSLFDAKGQKVCDMLLQPGQNQAPILPSGCYYLILKSEEGIISRSKLSLVEN